MRAIAVALLLPLFAAACADGGVAVRDPQFPTPHAISPWPNDLPTCPRGVGCY